MACRSGAQLGPGGVTVILESRWPASFLSRMLCFPPCSVPGRALCEQVEADVSMLVQDKWAAPQSNKDCEIFDINIRLR